MRPTEYVPVRFRPDQLDAMDAVIGRLGGTRSDFVRIAVDERLNRMQRVMAMLEDDPAQAYHEGSDLSSTPESETGND